MVQQAARLLTRMGLVLLILSLLIRLVSMSKANLVGDDLAIAASLLAAVVGVVPRLRSPRPRARALQQPRSCERGSQPASFIGGKD